MTDKELVRHNLQIINAMTQDGASPPLDEYWNEIVDLLSQNMEQTRQLLFSLEAEEIARIGGYYEDVAYNLKDYAFIDLMKELQQKYPEIDMEMDIQWAIDALD